MPEGVYAGPDSLGPLMDAQVPAVVAVVVTTGPGIWLEEALSSLAAQLLELAGADLTLQTDPALLRPVDVPVLRGNAERLRAATGWVPQIPLATTLADVLASWEAD